MAAGGCPEAPPERNRCRVSLKNATTPCMLRCTLRHGHGAAGGDQQQEAPGELRWAPGGTKEQGRGQGGGCGKAKGEEDKERHRGAGLPSSSGRGLEPPRWGQRGTGALGSRSAANSLSALPYRALLGAVTEQGAPSPGAVTERGRGRHQGSSQSW